jgi:hypothetical protein
MPVFGSAQWSGPAGNPTPSAPGLDVNTIQNVGESGQSYLGLGVGASSLRAETTAAGSIPLRTNNTQAVPTAALLALQVGGTTAWSLANGAQAGGTNVGGTVYFGTGAPVNASGVNGDIYLRVDGGAATTIYQRRAGAWVGIV